MVNIKIVTAPGCTNCEVVKKMIFKVVNDYDYLNVEEIELISHPEVAIKYGIMSTPGIIINEQLVFSGGINELDLRKIIESANK